MRKTDELNQQIAHREQIVNDLKNPNEIITGVGIRFQSKSTSFLNSEPCDFSDIVELLIKKTNAEIKVLQLKLPEAQKIDALRDQEIKAIETEVDNLIGENNLVQARMSLASAVSKGYTELSQKLEDVNVTIALLNPR